MSSPLRSPRALTEWLELDYFRRPRRLRRARRWAAWGVLLAALALAALLMAWGRPAIYQAGPVSQAHTMFNHDCGLCHTRPFQTPKRLWPTRAGFHSVTDDACKTCHDGAEHHALVPATGCAGCHQEHRGQQFLALVPDRHCTTCHAHLSQHPANADSLPNVGGFAAGEHPEFHDRADPSQVRFNHQVHLREEGLLDQEGKRQQLDCATCHQAEGDHRYMAPISYASHCARCHPLSVLVVGSFQDEGARVAARRFSALPAPHDSPDIVRAVLRERYRAFFRAFIPSKPIEKVREIKRPFPGKVQPPPRPEKEEDWVTSQGQLAERLLFAAGGRCRTCHLETGAPWQPGQLPQYAKTYIPDRWFPASRFSHDRHRLLRCEECHSQVMESTQAKDVLMPRIGVCQNCHNPRVGARYDCSECHTYHDRDKEAPGGGKLRIRDCLRGR
jgi:hypothetical protein